MDTLTTLAALRMSADKVNESIDIVINAVEYGEINVLDALVQADALKKFADGVKKGVGENAIAYIERNGGEVELQDGRRAVLGESGVKYDYSVSAEWLNLQRQIEALEDRRRALETRIKTARPDSPFFDADAVEITGVPKTSTTIVKIIK